MNETRKTLMYVGVAVVMVVLAMATAPRKITPNAFLDQGEVFFPDFIDPNEAKTLEVISFDDETASALPFKVTFKGGRWSIPSHHDYPADGKDRLAQTAAGVIDLKKDDFRSDNVSDHEALGVVDPLDAAATSYSGRGQRITIKGDNDKVLADFIIGNEIEGREGMRFVRVPGQKRVYAARTDVDPSTSFKDWIEPDLLQVSKDDIDNVDVRDYRINEGTGAVDVRDELVFAKGETGDWAINGMADSQEIDVNKMNQFLTALQDLTIEGVRPKPEGLSATLTRSVDSLRITQADMLSLQGKGYFFTRDGRLMSNEGELQVATNKGVRYTLRFGEIVYGSGLAVTAGSDDNDGGGSGENRYLFITASFDPAQFGTQPPMAPNIDYQSKPDSLWTEEDLINRQTHEAYRAWLEGATVAKQLAQELNARFALWYYVISAKSFDDLHMSRGDIVKEKDQG